jgi:hypothetical protein
MLFLISKRIIDNRYNNRNNPKMILIKYIINDIARKRKQAIFCVSSILILSLIILADYVIIDGIERGLKRSINQVISEKLLIVSGKNKDTTILESQLNAQESFVDDADNLNELKRISPDSQSLV